jgi:hypothetical protein
MDGSKPARRPFQSRSNGCKNSIDGRGWERLASIKRLQELADDGGLKLWMPEPGRPTEVARGVEMRSDWWR